MAGTWGVLEGIEPSFLESVPHPRDRANGADVSAKNGIPALFPIPSPFGGGPALRGPRFNDPGAAPASP